MTELSSFHDVLFPLGVSFGATGGPERRNEIVALTSGREKRNARFSQSRHYYDAGTGVRSLDDLHEVIDFFEARRGSLHAFRFRDPFDMKSCRPGAAPSPLDQAIGVGDGVSDRFPLAKVYGAGDDAYRRLVMKPRAESLRVAVATVVAPGHLPAAGAVITAGYEFDVPVRFDTERLSVNLKAFKAGQIPSIPLVEVQL